LENGEKISLFGVTGNLTITGLIRCAGLLMCSSLDYERFRETFNKLSGDNATFNKMNNKRKEIYSVVLPSFKKSGKKQTLLDGLFADASKTFSRPELENDAPQRLMKHICFELTFYRMVISIVLGKIDQPATSEKEKSVFTDLLIFSNFIVRGLMDFSLIIKSNLDALCMTNFTKSKHYYPVCVSGDKIAGVFMAYNGFLTIFNNKLSNTSTEARLVYSAGSPLGYLFSMIFYCENDDGIGGFLERIYRIRIQAFVEMNVDISHENSGRFIELVSKIFDGFVSLTRRNVGEPENDYITRVFKHIHDNDNDFAKNIFTTLNTEIGGVYLIQLLFQCINDYDLNVPNWVNKISITACQYEIVQKTVSDYLFYQGAYNQHKISEDAIDFICHDTSGLKIKIAGACFLISSLIFNTIFDYFEIEKKIYPTLSDTLITIKTLLRGKSQGEIEKIVEIIYKNVYETFRIGLTATRNIETFKTNIYDRFKDADYLTSRDAISRSISEQLGGILGDVKKTEYDKYFNESGNDDYNLFADLSQAFPQPLKLACHVLTIHAAALERESANNFQAAVTSNLNTAIYLKDDRENFVVGLGEHFYDTTSTNKMATAQNDSHTVSFETVDGKTISFPVGTLAKSTDIGDLNRSLVSIDYVDKGTSVPFATSVTQNFARDSAAPFKGGVTVCNEICFAPRITCCRNVMSALLLQESPEQITKAIYNNNKIRSSVENETELGKEPEQVTDAIINALNNASSATADDWNKFAEYFYRTMFVDLSDVFSTIFTSEQSNTINELGETVVSIDRSVMIRITFVNSETNNVFTPQVWAPLKGTKIAERTKKQIIDYIEQTVYILLGREIERQDLKEELQENVEQMKFIVSRRIYDFFKHLERTITGYSFDPSRVRNVNARFGKVPGYTGLGGAAAAYVTPLVTPLNKFSEDNFTMKTGSPELEKPTMVPVELIEESLSESSEKPKITQEHVSINIEKFGEMYEITEKDKIAKFDEYTLENGDKLYIAQYGVYTLIDDEGHRVMFPIKTEEQLAEVQERFKPLRPNTYIGGKGRRANRGAIKPKKTKKRVSNAPLKRITKNKNKNKKKNNKSEKKNKKNHYNNRKKTRR
jgi:hypothetical protein